MNYFCFLFLKIFFYRENSNYWEGQTDHSTPTNILLLWLQTAFDITLNFHYIEEYYMCTLDASLLQLNYLWFFCHLESISAATTSNTKPFQRLLFLVRDWQFPTDAGQIYNLSLMGRWNCPFLMGVGGLILSTFFLLIKH